ncbi:putative 3-phenylpropionic acid transporter [Anaerotignum neopropionicum]|uniref:Putative 3-phenylpropionic acid transporter n=1 Tax=Anaerotignum neopropionicum TaxID=36847 RepID=A0A136WC19_9FIRM|nr:MFS transporter [Anaerotignum neopropionicum]KXL52063.1 putative 3-phenylpropionic acid transporter [Anaerotignum neopropionicum]
MKKDNFVYFYGALQGLYWMSYGSSVTFTAVFLLDHGFSNGSIGTLIAISGFLSVLLQPVIACAADKGTHFTVKRVFMLLCMAQIIPYVLLSIFPLPKIVIALLYSLLILLQLSIQPIISALGIQLMQNEVPLNFGVARGIGSFAYSVLTFFLGTLTVVFSTKCLPMTSCGLVIIILFFLHQLPDMGSHQAVDIPHGGTIAVLKSSPRFALLVVGIACIFVSHSSINNYMIHILNRIGEGNEALGRMMAYTAILEVPAMLFCTRIIRKWDCAKLLRFTAIFFVLKGIGVTFASNLTMLYLALSFQAISFAPFTAAIVYYVSGALGKQDQVKGQALVTIGITVGNILGSLAGGYILQYFNVAMMLWLTTASCILGMVFFLVGVQNTTNKSIPYEA